jgi:hypothetical protein
MKKMDGKLLFLLLVDIIQLKYVTQHLRQLIIISTIYLCYYAVNYK